MAKDKFITMRIEEKVRTALKEIAKRERRTLTNLLSLILEQAVERDAKRRTK